jgi:DNA-directed RNA polymerase specialized sigma24 family protein
MTLQDRFDSHFIPEPNILKDKMAFRIAHMKANPEQRQAIRLAYLQGESKVALAKEYGLNRATIWRIVHEST